MVRLFTVHLQGHSPVVYNFRLCSHASFRSFSRYVGINANATEKWPYLPDDFEAPEWQGSTQNWVQVYLLFITLLSNFVPLSLYVTIEVVTVFLRILINWDVNMYDEFTDTRTVARSTTVTDLGQVEYIFSDKTGTLTQNVMRFKRCSVDSLVFGAPIIKSTPTEEQDGSATSFHPLSKLLVGKVPSVDNLPPPSKVKRQSSGGLESLGQTSKNVDLAPKAKVMTFNAEMFLRVMSLCHTVVVEKDFDAKKGVINSAAKNAAELKQAPSFSSSIHHKLFGSKNSPPPPEEGYVEGEEAAKEEPVESKEPSNGKGSGGAPKGFAYQAESPDEGALVEASSLNFDYQVIGRGSSGIKLSVAAPSLLSDQKIMDGFKDGSLTEMAVAADTSSPDGKMGSGATGGDGLHEETWEVLAVNKFDSTRKRMSILVRSPPELGSIPMILCKGADSAMLDAKVLRNPTHAMLGDENAAEISQRGAEPDESKEAEWDRGCILSLQSHLGEFAREGLRTLVLGVRVLTEKECSDWLEEYTSAATSLKNRDEKLTAAAQMIECKIHVVGATAIEDKLQVGVPDTIALLGRAGIKLWVLTGDKRETAKEIGYATKVLSEKMRPGLIEVPSGTENEVRVKMAMAFLKLVKYAELPDYQTAAISLDTPKRLESFLFHFGKVWRRISRTFRRFYHKRIKICFMYFLHGVSKDDPALKAIDVEAVKEIEILQLTERHRNVRNRAEKIVRDYLSTPEGASQRKTRGKVDTNAEIPLEDMNIPSSGPDVFDRAGSARGVLQDRLSKGGASDAEIRDLTMANLTAYEVASSGEFGDLVDEDILSMQSFLPTDGEQNKRDFDKMKRTLFERLFAVDKSTRHGRLVKHLKKDKLASITEDGPAAAPQSELKATGDVALDGPRGLVIEGAALEKLLGDSELEELLFAVANTCDSVIACRVSPAQKAQLVQLVRRYVVPEPVTLAIGDGANDVGMIQEAHIGIGISGKEGQQAVNASDFAIAQFRFLQDLTLIHGRWNFMRLSVVVLFSFYKNAVMAGVLIAYTSQSLFSGTPLFDEWIIAMLNFVANFPILFLGMFDRCLDRDYVFANPDTYTPTRRNELITKRILGRWVITVFAHVFTIYYFTVPPMAVDGGGATAAFVGLMRNDNPDRPGDGESGDLKSVGFVAYTILILLLALKVLFESKSIVIGRWPAFQPFKKDAEGFVNRLAYTWIGTGILSIGFYLVSVMIYQSLGRTGPSSFSQFVNTVNHVFGTSVRAWMLIMFVPIAAISFDVTGKLFSNLYYPTQTQIHMEIFTGKGKKTAQYDQRSVEVMEP
jgi:magnesium-transporting ATPase (P-type)